MISGRPSAAMLAVADKLAVVLESGARRVPDDLFARDVVIVENFAPFLFTGPDAVARWTKEMQAHLADLSTLRHTFVEVHDFSRSGDDVYFSIRTQWRGLNRGVPFEETGGWALVLTLEDGAWRLRSYGWAVIESDSALVARE